MFHSLLKSSRNAVATLSQRCRHFLDVLVEVTKPNKTLSENTKTSSAVDAHPPPADYDFSGKTNEKSAQTQSGKGCLYVFFDPPELQFF